MKSIIKDIIVEYQNIDFPKVIRRDIEIPNNLNIIVSIIGARRCGKTYVLYQIIEELYAKGIKKEQILFLNFEDERLPLNVGDLDLILQAYMELFPKMPMQDVYFFFDEIQNVEGWEKFIRRMYDTISRRIFITGSNSKLLSTEIATELRGRTITYTIYPLSFNEYLRFHSVTAIEHPAKNKANLIHYSYNFLKDGGFPETVFFDRQVRLKIHQQYFNTMIFRDIVERYKVTNTEILKFFIKKIFAGVTKPFSVNKTYNDLKSMGYKISNKYLYDYQKYCDAIFLTQSVNKFDYSEIRQSKSDQKTYIIDTGLLSSIVFSVSEDNGKLLENAIALEFMKAEIEIFYYKDYHECDFVTKINDRFYPVQVAYKFDDKKTKQRELKGLADACDYLRINKGTIITLDTEEEIQYDTISVTIVPFYKYFLSLSDTLTK